MDASMNTKTKNMISGLFVLLLLATVSEAQAAERKLSFAVSGVVASVKVGSGEIVKAGTVLAVLDQTTFLARKRSADANADATKLILDLAEVKARQVRELFDALSTSQEEVDKVETALANARSGYEAARSRAKIAKWRLQRSTLNAPFSGTVSSVAGYPGMVVNTYAGVQTVVIINAR